MNQDVIKHKKVDSLNKSVQFSSFIPL